MSSKSAGDRLRKVVYTFSSLNDLGEVITSKGDFREVARSGLYVILGTLSAAQGAIFRFDSSICGMMPVSCRGVEGEEKISLRLKGQDREAFLQVPHLVDLKQCPEPLRGFYKRNRKELERLSATLVLPLRMAEELLGMIAVGGRFSGGTYSEEDLQVLSLMCQQLSVALYNQKLFTLLQNKAEENRVLYKNLHAIYSDTIKAFATAIDAKDEYTRGHSARVSQYAVAIGEELGLSGEELEALRLSGLLHDIGKIAVDNAIIRKTSGLTEEERMEMHRHPAVGSEILSKIRFPWGDLSTLARHHHEKVDGNGYPDGLRGAELPPGVRIITLADAFDAMTTDRPYRKKISLAETLKEIRRCVGTHFDERTVEGFFRVLEKELSGSLPNPRILPCLRENFDAERILGLLRGLICEGSLSANR